MSNKAKAWLAAGAALAVLLGLLVFAGRQVLTDRALDTGLAALAAAERLPQGPARQDRLAEAHDRFAEVLNTDRGRIAAWLGRAQVHYLTASAAADLAERQALLAASAEAAAQAQRLDPTSPRPSALMAQALAELGERGPARTALADSYARKPLAPELARQRVATGLSLWSVLAPELRAAVTTDLCEALKRAPDGPALIQTWAAASRNEPDAAVLLTTQVGDAACTGT